MSIVRKILRWFFAILSIVVSVGLLVSAYAGHIDPLTQSYAAVMCLTFPIWLALILVVLVIDLIWYRWHAIVPALALVCCAPFIWDFTPLNFKSVANDPDVDKNRTFTLMTYNALHCENQQGQYPDSTNLTIQYIQQQNADIVCLQEVFNYDLSSLRNASHAQIESLRCQYPYMLFNVWGQAVLSKTEIEAITLDEEVNQELGLIVSAYRVNIKGTSFAIFNVHLASIRLNEDDRTLYSDVIKLKTEDKNELKRVRHQLIDKLRLAAISRSTQVKQLVRLIKRYGGENVIVCGDFNDVPGCFALQYLSENANLKQVYPQVGLGPMITYNSDYLYFRIDHILYRGAVKPISDVRGDIKYSDHYPQTVTFALQ